MGTLKAILKIIRPKTLLWFCVATCMGFAAIIQHKIPSTSFYFLVLTLVFANIGAIIVNDICDIDVDSKSKELSIRSRPLVTGVLTIREAIILAVIFYALSLLSSFAYDLRATVFSIVVIIFSLTYSLEPTKFCARPYTSILYWVVLCIICYLLMLNALTTIDKTMKDYLQYKIGWIFITGIILYMGVSEIIAKDLRDYLNDKEGGRNTFVNFVGVETASRVMLFSAWLGFILWAEALYLSVGFHFNIPAILCITIGVFWCIRITIISIKLSNKFDQSLATSLHKYWTYSYATMQILTFLTFLNYKK